MLSRRASAAAEPGTSRYAITPAEDRNSEIRWISGTARRRFCAGCPIAFAPLPRSGPDGQPIESSQLGRPHTAGNLGRWPRS